MAINKVVYEKIKTGKWVAEINVFDTPLNSHFKVVKKRIWQRVFDTREEAEAAAQREMDRMKRDPECRFTASNV